MGACHTFGLRTLVLHRNWDIPTIRKQSELKDVIDNMKKKIRELTWDDIGKEVAFDESDGDRSTGKLTSMSVVTPTDHPHSSMSIGIGNAMISGVKPDEVIEFLD